MGQTEFTARAKVLLGLADASWKSFESRRSYEWKTNFGLWAGLGAFAGLLYKGDIAIPNLYLAVILSCLSFLLWLGYWLFWSAGLEQRNAEDQDVAHFYWSRVDSELTLTPPRKPPDRRSRPWMR